MSKEFWDRLVLPTQDVDPEVEFVNPAIAYRKQVEAINLSAPLYAELEEVDAKLRKARRVEASITRRILAANMAQAKSSEIRTNDLVDAFVLDRAREFVAPDGTVRDYRPRLLKLRRAIGILEGQKAALERRIAFVQHSAEALREVLNWNKHLARLELGR